MTAQASPFNTFASDPGDHTLGRLTLAASLAVGVSGAVMAASLGLRVGLPPSIVALALPVVLMVAGVVLFLGSQALPVPERSPWRSIATGVVLVGFGQAGHAVVGEGVGSTPLALFGLAFYVLAGIGLLRMPRVRTSRWGVVRMAMDVVAGMAAAATLLWEAQGGVFADGTTALAAHVFLIGAMMVAALRTSPYVVDLRLLVILIGFAPVIVVTRLGPTVSPTRSTLLWSITVIALGVASWLLGRPLARRQLSIARPPRRRLVLPYAPVVGVGVLFASRVFGGADLAEGALPWGLLVVILAVVGRSIAATREGRRIMALERDQLLASLSHDLRTPLTAVTGFADVLYDSWVELRGTERLEMVDIIRAEAAALSDIVGDLAALARHELEAVPLQMERVEGKRLVAEAIRLVFDVTAPIPVKAEVEPYLELVGDRRRLVQVLRALLENAQRYGRGRILVVVRRDEGGRIIEVHDDGDGVDPRRVRSIWQRFERGENNLNAGVPGSGLGLAVVRGLARAHGGDAGYRRSDRLGGACFYVEIPYDRAALGEE